MVTRRAASILVVMAAFLGAAGAVRGDTIALTNGGQWEGTILSESADEVVIQTFAGPVTVPRTDITGITRGPTRRQLYEKRRASVAQDDVQGQLALAQWCRGQGLRDESDYHYELVLALDQDNAEAHEALGHTLVDGRWLTRTEVMQARGLVRYRGRWLEPGEAERRRKAEVKGQLELEWRRRIRRLIRNLQRGRKEYHAQAVTEFLAIEDPVAAPVINELLTHRDPTVRRLAVTVVEAHGFRGGDQGLVALAVTSGDGSVRRLARSALRKGGGERAFKLLIEALSDGKEQRRRRAALALGELGDRRAVPALIENIRQTIVVSGGGGAALGGQSYVRDFDVAVAPGAVAYDPQVGTIGFRRRPRVRVKTIVNDEAVTALGLITGLQYGDDQAAWRKWWNREGRDFLRGLGSYARPAGGQDGATNVPGEEAKEE